MKQLNGLIFITLITFLFTACGGSEGSKQESSSSAGAEIKGGQASVQDDLSAKNIVQIAASSEDHTTLVAAVQAAGMADVIPNPGPLTVFAPTNEALRNYRMERSKIY